MENRHARMAGAFAERLGGRPSFLARGPGRANLIGEHTDYNDGFVLPMAINRDLWLALRARPDQRVRLWSLDFNEGNEFELDAVMPDSEGHWSNYLRGVAAHLAARQPLRYGFDAVLHGTVPIGSGLSSSAALEVATAVALAAVNGLELTPAEIARITQQAENAFVGVPCGIMDQFVSAAAQKDHALLLDCRSLETEQVALPRDLRIVVSESGVSRSLAGVGYRERRAACEAAAEAIGVPALRDVTPEMLEAAVLPHEIAKRARHVVEENGRVLAAVGALRSGEIAVLGELVSASHASLRDLYEVSIPELNLLVEIAESVPGCYGARLTGAGFGGCTIALASAEAAPHVAAAIEMDYPRRSGYETKVYICEAERGASVEAWEA
jgi:galactokinase